MNYKRYGNDLVMRLDKGDEIISSLISVSEKENIRAASFSAIGATDDFDIGVFSLEKSTYDNFSFKGNHEITNLCGNITYVDNKPYVHAHITCAGEEGKIVGGHLFRADISLTCEIFIRIIDGEIGRRHNDEININIFDI